MSTDKEPKGNGLEYFISEKDSFAVVTFVGEMKQSTLAVLEKCQKELQACKATHFTIVFHDLAKVDFAALGRLKRLQVILREKGWLKLCDLRPEVMDFLLANAAILDSEYEENLADALASHKIDQAKMKLPKKE